MTILLESAIRVTLIAAIIALALLAMRIKAASVVHAVWAGVVVLMMLLPAWVAWGPKAPLPVLPPDRASDIAALPSPSPAGLVSTTPASLLSTPDPSPAREGGGYMAIYLLGVGVFLLRLAIGTFRASRLTSASCVVPVTVGLLYPRIILPEVSRDWPQAQLDAVLAHEREHARRRDPLFQWLALLNRALFWFHPLAWWLERKLSGLAEEACDAAVIARGYDPREYSGYLLDLAKSVQRAGMRIDAVGMAMPGIGLKHRIQQLLSGVPIPKISRPRVACTVAVCAVGTAILAAGTLVHAQVVRPAFEVASVRAIKPGEHAEPSFEVSPIGLTIRRENMRGLVSWAYHVDAREISGPTWLDTQDFDITAKAGGPASPDQLRLMLQTLLEQRFKLAVHREQRILPLYILSVGKNGPKLHEVQEEPRKGGRLGWADSVFTYQMVNRISQLTQLLPDFLDGRPVQDKTGLAGVYEITLSVQMDPEQIKRMPQRGMVFGGFGYTSGVFDAVEKLGLKLESTRGPVDFVVIDHVEKPSEN